MAAGRNFEAPDCTDTAYAAPAHPTPALGGHDVDDEQDRLGIPVALGLHGDDFKLTAAFVDADPQPRRAALGGRDGRRGGTHHDQADLPHLAQLLDGQLAAHRLIPNPR